MNKPATSMESLDLTVRFVGGPPIDEVVYWIRRCAERQLASGPLTVVLDAQDKSRMHEVRIERPDRILVTERDPNIMLAVRNAFKRLPLAHAEFTAADEEHGTRAVR